MATGKGSVAAGTILIEDSNQITSTRQNYKIPICMAGTTAQRPKAGDPDVIATNGYLQAGIHYLDTTLQYIIVSGENGMWYNPYSGAAV
jgi:hypothetical protein